MQIAKYSSFTNMFIKNYALLVFLSFNFLNFRLRVDGLRVLSKAHSEDGSKDINMSCVKKTINTKYGDIIDCIDIFKQHAFDHPLLKNHRIQERPNFPKEWTKSSSIAQVIDLEGLRLHQECPHGTVPIRRNTNKISSILQKPLGETDNHTEHVKMGAGVHVIRKDIRYVAAKAQIDIQNPKCKLGESSSANVWFIDGVNKHINLLLAGWAVNPTLYGDGNTRLSTFWADLIYNTGCFDLTCSGFVQVDRVVPLGVVLPNISVPGGPKYLITITIFQDQETKNWWLHFGETNTSIGYWPKEIFSYFTNGASRIDFGGFVEVYDQPNHPIAMGSGIIPDGTSNYNYVSYFSHIEYMDQDNVTRTLLDQDIKIYHDDAYGVEFHSSEPGKGSNFLYGGPNSLKIVSRQSANDVKEM